MAAAMIGQGVGLLVSFFARMVFLQSLGKEFLGLNGLFTNVLTMLSLVELGIGPAIIFSLYQPLADHDERKVRALMGLYRRAYRIIGCLVALLGCAVTPLLSLLIKDISNIGNIRLYFLLFVLNSAVSYLYSYKRSLIIADQRQYFATIYHYVFYAVVNLLQIFFLRWTESFIVFLLLQIACTFGENISVSRCADRLYPFLKNKETVPLDAQTSRQIYKNTCAMVLHKIGDIVVNSTDNILISTIVGTVWVGIYSNYQLITKALTSILSQVFGSLTASIGNLGASESQSRTKEIFQAVFFVNFWIYGFCAISLCNLIQPFISLWLGGELLLPLSTAFLITLNFYLSGMRKAVLTFREALGLYWYDRYKPIFEVTVNLAVSVVLGFRLGVTGIFIGTAISTLTTCFWIEPYILYKHGLHASVFPYFVRYLLYAAVTAFAGLITLKLCGLIPLSGNAGLFAKTCVCVVVPNAIFFLLFFQSREFRFLWNKYRHIVLPFLKRTDFP